MIEDIYKGCFLGNGAGFDEADYTISINNYCCGECCYAKIVNENAISFACGEGIAVLCHKVGNCRFGVDCVAVKSTETYLIGIFVVCALDIGKFCSARATADIPEVKYYAAVCFERIGEHYCIIVAFEKNKIVYNVAKLICEVGGGSFFSDVGFKSNGSFLAGYCIRFFEFVAVGSNEHL